MTQPETVTVRIPTNADMVVLLRTAVGGFAARDQFTLDQVNDLRMAVEEGAVQLLHRGASADIQLDVSTTTTGIEVRLHAEVSGSGPVIDEASFSWTILRELADDLRVEQWQQRASIVMTKHRTILSQEA